MKRGPKPKVTMEDQKSVFLKYKDSFREGLPNRNDKVYSQLQSELQFKMSIRSIQLSLLKNFTYFFDQDLNVTESVLDSPENTSSFDSKTHTFLIDIISWKEIQPKQYFYRRRDKRCPNSLYNSKLRLPINKWTNFIQLQLWKALRLVCTWCFRSNWAKSDYEVNCTGYCKQCHANISLTSHLKTEEMIEIKCTVTNWHKGSKHSTNIKNQIRSKYRQKLAETLQHESPALVRYNMAAKLMTPNDSEPPVLPKLHTVQQIKYENRIAERFHANPILSLAAMSETPPFDKCVRRVSAKPFFTFYWTEDQIQYYKKCQKELNYVRVAIDATGSIFDKNLRPIINEHTHLAFETQGPIFLYVMMTDTTINSSIPISQAISESHNMETIINWLNLWLSDRKPPNEVVTDDSAALIGAVVKVFCGLKSTNEYLKHCFQILETRETQLPKCYVRLDTSHFINSLHHQSIFKNLDKRVAHFYINCIRAIKKCTSYDEVKSIIQNIFVVANHKYRGSNLNGQVTRCELSINNLRKLSDSNIDLMQAEVSTNDSNLLSNVRIWEEAILDEQNPLTVFYENLESVEYLIIQLGDDEITDIENLYYLPNLKDTLLRLLKKLPLWGNVMNNFFLTNDSAPSSSNVENYFKDIKKLFFKTSITKYRVDEFVTKHHSLISGALCLATSKLKEIVESEDEADYENDKKQTDEFEKAFYDNSIFRKSPKYTENWRGLVTTRQMKKREINRRIRFHILKNGSLATSGTSKIIFNNTCAFDSLIQSLSIAYLDRLCIKKYIVELNNDLSALIQSLITYRNIKRRGAGQVKSKTLKNSKISKPKGIYTLRSKLLQNIYMDEISTNESINCESNITKVVDYLKNYGLYSADRFLKCTNVDCNVNENPAKKCSYIPLNIEMITTDGFKVLQEAALIYDEERFCKFETCSGKNAYHYELQNLIFFEIHDTSPCNINDIPKHLTLKGVTYKILSVIDYTGAVGSMGHYTCKCYRSSTQVWNCFDDLKSKNTRFNSCNILPHCLIYTKI